MRISKRLYKLAECVRPGDSVADIGTDHGYVPMLLIRSGKSPRVIMSDISDGSLAKARETFSIAGLMDRVDENDFRTGDGLATIEAGETDEVIIAGLGGHTIAEILDADLLKSRSFSRLVLQPRKHSGSLRHYLYTNGWDIEEEFLAEEGKFACEILTAVPSGEVFRESVYPEDDIRWKYPEAIVKADPVLARNRIGWKIGSIEEQLSNLEKSGGSHKELMERLKSDLLYLKVLMQKTG